MTTEHLILGALFRRDLYRGRTAVHVDNIEARRFDWHWATIADGWTGVGDNMLPNEHRRLVEGSGVEDDPERWFTEEDALVTGVLVVGRAFTEAELKLVNPGWVRIGRVAKALGMSGQLIDGTWWLEQLRRDLDDSALVAAYAEAL